MGPDDQQAAVEAPAVARRALLPALLIEDRWPAAGPAGSEPWEGARLGYVTNWAASNSVESRERAGQRTGPARAARAGAAPRRGRARRLPAQPPREEPLHRANRCNVSPGESFNTGGSAAQLRAVQAGVGRPGGPDGAPVDVQAGALAVRQS